MFIHLDVDNQEIPCLRGVNSCTVYIAFIEKYESCEVKFVRNFTLADKNNRIISIRTSLRRQKAKDHEMCPENI